MNRLIANRWKTPDGTILWSKYTHDYQGYKDKNDKYYAVDGGNSYSKLIGDYKDLKNVCIYSNGTFELEREWVLWGRNYDKDMNMLEETQWTPIKDLDTDHIYKILELNISYSYRRLMEEEIIYREEQILKSWGITQ